MSYLDRIKSCNQYDISQYIPFLVNQEVIGWVKPSFAQHLYQWPDVFTISNQAVQISPDLTTVDSITTQLDQVTETLFQQGIVDTWVGEKYPAVQTYDESPRFYIERAVTHYFGLRSFGVHLNGLVKKSDGLYLWIAERSRSKPFWPGKLDQMIAGGQPAHLTLMENVIKESAEEANVPRYLAQQAKYITSLSYCSEGSRGINPDTLFVYDLWLPESFEPENTDQEVESFQLIRIDELAEFTEHTTQFKDNCNLVNIDLLIRLGLITSDHPQYKTIVDCLYQSSSSIADL